MRNETDPLISSSDVEGNNKDDKFEEECENPALEDDPFCERIKDVVFTTWSLGFVTFGDTSSQVAIIQDQICHHRNWMSDNTFMELFALSRALPGPLATQLVIAVAFTRAGPLGGLIALILWVLPGLILMTILGLMFESYVNPDGNTSMFLVGIPPATVALVMKAAFGFGVNLDRFGFGLAVCSCMGALLVNGDVKIASHSAQFAYPLMLAAGGILSLLDATLPFLPQIGVYEINVAGSDAIMKHIGVPIWAGLFVIQTWLIVLLATILLVKLELENDEYLILFESFFRIGSIIFGGGEDVLALLESEMVPDIVTQKQFFQGLGLSQAMPGPLFNFVAFIGAVNKNVYGALLSVVGIFTPSYMFMVGGLPLWAKMRQIMWFKAILQGVNAVAVGFIFAATVFLWESSITKAANAMVFTLTGALATFYNLPPPVVMLVASLSGALFHPNCLDLGQVPYE